MSNIAEQRLYNQRLSHNPLHTPAEVVSWFGAVQAQDYGPARWGVAQRATGLTDAAIEKAFNAGEILRTHIMRPTWHFVTPEDICWILMLTAPRVHTVNAYMYRKLELDDDLFVKSHAAFEKALQGGKHLTRTELGKVLTQVGIVADGMRLGYIVSHAELEGVLCSGARRGKQFTYALIAEQAPQAKTLDYDEALAELTKRFFQSHGPATVDDFAWWSGLTKAEVRRGLEMIKAQVVQEKIDGHDYWSIPVPTIPEVAKPAVYLLPQYDEYGIAYKKHSASSMLNPMFQEQAQEIAGAIFNSTIIIDGQVIGFWRRRFNKESVAIETRLFRPLTDSEHEAFVAATQRFSAFHQMPVELPK
jgi:hypothetical protein